MAVAFTISFTASSPVQVVALAFVAAPSMTSPAPALTELTGREQTLDENQRPYNQLLARILYHRGQRPVRQRPTAI